MRDGVAGNAVDARCGIDLFEAVERAQGVDSHLPGRGLFARGHGCEGEGAASARAEQPAHDAGLAHRHGDHVGDVAVLLQQLEHREIVGERARGRHDLVELGIEALHALERLLQAAGVGEVVIAEDERCTAGAQPLPIRGTHGLGRLDFDIDELAAGLRRAFQYLCLLE